MLKDRFKKQCGEMSKDRNLRREVNSQQQQQRESNMSRLTPSSGSGRTSGQPVTPSRVSDAAKASTPPLSKTLLAPNLPPSSFSYIKPSALPPAIGSLRPTTTTMPQVEVSSSYLEPVGPPIAGQRSRDTSGGVGSVADSYLQPTNIPVILISSNDDTYGGDGVDEHQLQLQQEQRGDTASVVKDTYGGTLAAADSDSPSTVSPNTTALSTSMYVNDMFAGNDADAEEIETRPLNNNNDDQEQTGVVDEDDEIASGNYLMPRHNSNISSTTFYSTTSSTAPFNARAHDRAAHPPGSRFIASSTPITPRFKYAPVASPKMQYAPSPPPLGQHGNKLSLLKKQPKETDV